MRILLLLIFLSLSGCGFSDTEYSPYRVTQQILNAQKSCMDHGGIQVYRHDTWLEPAGPFHSVICRDEKIFPVSTNFNGKEN